MMPLTKSALRHIERLLPLKKHLMFDIVPQLTLLRGEMLITDPHTQQTAYCDILLEELRHGTPLKEALAESQADAVYASVLDEALYQLYEELQQADLSLNNLREENLILGNDNRLYPIRWHYATKGVGADESTFEALHAKLADAKAHGVLHEVASHRYHSVDNMLSGYLGHRAMSEGLIAIENDEGWGFIDTRGDIVITPQYDWVDRFYEGRAEVQKGDKMGLIDKQGRYIIPLSYPVVDYNHETGNSVVKRGEEWALFDYAGKQLSPFSRTKPRF